MQKLLRLFVAPLKCPSVTGRMLVVAIRIVACFAILHLIGLRHETGILSGTLPPAGSAVAWRIVGGVLYILFYALSVTVAPILLLSTLILLAIERIRVAHKERMSPLLAPRNILALLLGCSGGVCVVNLDPFLVMLAVVGMVMLIAVALLIRGLVILFDRESPYLRTLPAQVGLITLGVVGGILLSNNIYGAAPPLLRVEVSRLDDKLQAIKQQTGEFPTEIDSVLLRETSITSRALCRDGLQYSRDGSAEDYILRCLRGYMDERFIVSYSSLSGWEMEYVLLSKRPRPFR